MQVPAKSLVQDLALHRLHRPEPSLTGSSRAGPSPDLSTSSKDALDVKK